MGPVDNFKLRHNGSQPCRRRCQLYPHQQPAQSHSCTCARTARRRRPLPSVGCVCIPPLRSRLVAPSFSPRRFLSQPRPLFLAPFLFCLLSYQSRHTPFHPSPSLCTHPLPTSPFPHARTQFALSPPSPSGILSLHPIPPLSRAHTCTRATDALVKPSLAPADHLALLPCSHRYLPDALCYRAEALRVSAYRAYACGSI